MKAPMRNELIEPILKALEQLGGFGSAREIELKVIEIMGLTDEQVNEKFGGRKQSKLKFNLVRARGHLKYISKKIKSEKRFHWSLV